MHLDVPTLGILGFLIGIVLAVGLTLLALVLRGIRALRWWAASVWLATAASLLIGLRGPVPEGISVLAGNGALTLANACVLYGVALHVRFALRWRGPLLLSAGYLAVLAWFEFVVPALVPRMMAASVVAVIWDVWTIGVLLRFCPRDVRRSCHVVAVLFGLDIVYSVVRVSLLAPALIAPERNPLEPMVSAYVFGILLVIAQCLAFLLLVAERLLADLGRQARTDGLTGLLNRSAVMEEGQRTLELCRRNGLPCALLMFDLDHFKSINDSRGHHAGDAVLCHFAELIERHERRAAHVFARYGGEEFVLLLPGADAAQAMRTAALLRAKLAATPALFEGEPVPVTTSIGVATPQAGMDFDDLVNAADAALYRAKAAGRDRALMGRD